MARIEAGDRCWFTAAMGWQECITIERRPVGHKYPIICDGQEFEFTVTSPMAWELDRDVSNINEDGQKITGRVVRESFLVKIGPGGQNKEISELEALTA